MLSGVEWFERVRTHLVKNVKLNENHERRPKICWPTMQQRWSFWNHEELQMKSSERHFSSYMVFEISILLLIVCRLTLWSRKNPKNFFWARRKFNQYVILCRGYQQQDHYNWSQCSQSRMKVCVFKIPLNSSLNWIKLLIRNISIILTRFFSLFYQK